MKTLTWAIIGATSSIAKAFAHLAASKKHPLILIARDKEELQIMEQDLRLRYKVSVESYVCDLTEDISPLLNRLQQKKEELALFIAASIIFTNEELNDNTILELVRLNVQSLSLFIWSYLQKKQSEQRIIYLSSVAGSRGRAKNSLYGGTKAAIDIYLQGLQQAANPNLHISILRLGYIDTVQTYGKPGIFYASTSENCAKACWKASYKDKRVSYFPFFWRYIMLLMRQLPFFLYRKLAKL